MRAPACARTPGETQRVRNREACRDGFFSILREAHARLAALQQPAQAISAGGAADASTRWPEGAAAELLAAVRAAMQGLMQRLLPCNLPDLAQLFCACVLQVRCGRCPPLRLPGRGLRAASGWGVRAHWRSA